MLQGEAEERTVRRVEAFSDVVIGFSLATLGLSLTFPEHAGDLVNKPGWFVSFVWAFALICMMWWFHHQILSTIFTPRVIPVLLNFVWLAVVVLAVYSNEVTVRLASEPASWQMHFVLFAIAFGLLAMQYYFGLLPGGAVVSQDVRWRARRQGSIMALWTGAFVLNSFWTFVVPWGRLTILAGSATIVSALVGTALILIYRRAAQSPSA